MSSAGASTGLKGHDNATFIYHVITTYVTATNMPLKCHIYTIYASYVMYRDEKHVNILTSFELISINNVTSSTGIHNFTLLAFALK